MHTVIMIPLGDLAKSKYSTSNVRFLGKRETGCAVNKCSVEKLSESINHIKFVSKQHAEEKHGWGMGTGPQGIPVLKTQNSSPPKKKSQKSRSVKCLILHALTQ